MVLKEQFKTAKAKKQIIQSELDQAYLYTFPSIAPDKQAAPDRHALFDSTAPNSVNTLVSNLITFLIPQNSRWATIDIRESVLKQGVPGDQRVRLEKENTRLWEIIHDSNFYIAASEAMRDCVVGGVGCMAVEMTPTSDGLNYVSVPIGQLYIMENGSGVVDTVFREHSLPARVLVQRYNVPDWVKKENDKNPDSLVKVIESMCPCKDGKYDYKIVLEKDFHELDSYTTVHKVFTVFRWMKSTGDVWGDSPVRQALPDIKTLNTMVEQHLNASEFASRGGWITTDPTLQGKQLVPGEVIVASSDEALRPITFPGQMSITYQDIASLQQSVRARLYADQLPPAGEVKGVVATAINALQAQFFRSIAPAALRLEGEFLREIIVNTVRIAGKNKLMGDFIVNGKPLKITVKSVVSKGLDMEEVQQIMERLQLLTPFGEEALKQLKVQETIRYILKKTGFPTELLKEEEEQQPGMDQLQSIAQNAMTLVQNGGLPGTLPQ